MPDDAQALLERGNGLLAAERPAEALICFQQSLQLRPKHPQTMANLGMACAELGQLDEALRWYDAALGAEPKSLAAHYNRGNALRLLRRPVDALLAYDAALRLDAGLAEAWINRGLALMALGRVHEAIGSYREALRRRPSSPDLHNNLGLALQTLGYVEDALDHLNEAIRLLPEHVAAHANRAQAWLLRGDFARGWPEYEWRWRLSGRALPPRALPAWDGSALAERTVLLRHEQGLGDALQFVRYAVLIRNAGGRVVLECPKRLHRLLSTISAVERIIDCDGDASGCDVQIGLLSLPGLYRTSFRTIPAEVPYLSADAARVERWRSELPAGRRIGICWKGSSEYPEDVIRSIPLAAFAALAGLPGVRLVSLQRGEGIEQIAQFRKLHELHVLPADLDADGAFVDTAAVMTSLDLVVTCDTAIAHLAGALGRPVWLALPVCAEWRWLRDRDDSPWYPSARLFRQRTFGDWPGVFERMRTQLTAELP